jgi:hypothetical protein
MKRYLPFLLLNVLISALTTLLVLNWWDRTHRPAVTPPPTVSAQPVEVLPPATEAPTPTLPPVDQEVIRIETVIAAGDLNNEVVELARSGDGDLLLTGWAVEDQNGNRYTFPDLLMSKNGSVRLYSRAGENTVIELYWNASAAVWASGEQVTLLDPQENVRAIYTIP